MFKTLLLVFLSLSYAHAAETDNNAKLKDALSKHLGEVTQVNKSPIAGLYEVVTPGHIYYADEGGRYLIDGSMFELSSRSNLTEMRSRKLFAIDFNKLPLELAVKKVKGQGRRKMAYFTDPNCSYCKKLERELLKVNDVTLYLFLYPLFPGSAEKVARVWCSKDRAKAWDDLMAGEELAAANKCETPTAKVLALGKRFGVNGTPSLIFADGEVSFGYMPAAELEKALGNK